MFVSNKKKPSKNYHGIKSPLLFFAFYFPFFLQTLTSASPQATKRRKLPAWMLTSSDEENEAPLPPLALPCRIICCETETAANRLCQPLLLRLQEEPLTAGFDAEWPVSKTPGAQDRLALLQVSAL